MAKKRKKLTDTELLVICERKVKDAVAFGSSSLNAERAENLDYYLGKPFGNEQVGQSQVVTRDVAEAIDSLMPDLIEIFVSSETPVVFLPFGKEDIEGSQQATDYVNQLWRQHGGITLLYNWLKDGLLNKRGVVKCFWEDREWTVPENYEGLTQPQMLTLASDVDVDIAEISVRDPGGLDPAGAVDETGQPVMLPSTFDVEARRTNRDGYVCYVPVPPDEFLIDRNAVSDEEAPMIGHRSKKTRTELVEMGFPDSVVEDLTDNTDAEVEFSQERLKRFADDGSAAGLPRESADVTTDELWVVELYLRVDFDGDGKSELRKIIYAGQHVLVNEEVDDHPFATWCPHPIPHKFWGQSVADQTKDIQLIKSTILRQILNNLYLANNPEKIVLEGAVNIEDLLTSRPGGIKRVRQAGAIENFEYPFVAGQSFPVLEWLDQTLERRTGAMRQNQGLDPDAINKTATGIQKLMSAGARRERLIARLFAETGLTRLFKLTLKNIVKYQRVRKIVELRGKWVEMDPRNWRSDRDVRVNVGLGTESRDQTFIQIMAMLQIDAQLIQVQGGLAGPILTATNLYNKLAKLVEASGMKTPALYYTEPSPEANQPREPAPDPAMMKVQGELQIKQQESQAKLAQQQQESQAKLALQQQEAQLKLQIMQAEAKAEAQRKQQELAARVQIMVMEAQARAQLEGIELNVEAVLKKYEIDKQAEVDTKIGVNTNVRDPEKTRKAS